MPSALKNIVINVEQTKKVKVFLCEFQSHFHPILFARDDIQKKIF